MDTLGWITVLGGCTTVKRIYTFLDESGSLAIQAWCPKAAPVSRCWTCPHGGGKVPGVSWPWQWSSNALDSGLNVLSNSPSRPKATECPSEESLCAFLCGSEAFSSSGNQAHRMCTDICCAPVWISEVSLYLLWFLVCQWSNQAWTFALALSWDCNEEQMK